MKLFSVQLAVASLFLILLSGCGGGGGVNTPTPGTIAVTPPGTPTAVTASPRNAAAIVSFTAPAKNGGSSITSYTVTSSVGNISISSTASPITVTGLTNGTAYTFTVVATNSAGSSLASSASAPVTPAATVTVPGVPNAVAATAGNAIATVTFAAPASDGGSAITGYIVTSSPTGGVDSNAGTTGLTHTVTGLSNGTAYTFTAVATNSAGNSPTSSASAAVTPVAAVTVPGVPNTVAATAGNAIATVTFTAPASDGGATITGYNVTSSPAGGVDSNANTTVLTHTITGLSNGTAYTFTVVATNSAGNSLASSASAAVTPVAPTGTPSASTTALGSYIADNQNGSFVGSWFSGPPAEAWPSTMITTASPITFTQTFSDKLLTGTTWGTNPTPLVSYDLTSTGWVVTPSTITVVDSGDGSNMSMQAPNEPPANISVVKASLTGPISCSATTCVAPGSYPAGAASYTYTQTTGVMQLWGSIPVKTTGGTAFTSLPTVGSTFCDSDNLLVFAPISPAPATGVNNYNVYSTVSCSSSDITTALGTSVADTVLVSNQTTGITASPNVLYLSGASWLNDSIYGLRAGQVWLGSAVPTTGLTWTEENKIATNAELTASGLTIMP